MNVTPKKPISPKTGDFNLLESMIFGEAYREYYLLKRSIEGNKPNENPQGLICPKCGGTNLVQSKENKGQSHSPIQILKARLACGEITLEEFEKIKKRLNS